MAKPGLLKNIALSVVGAVMQAVPIREQASVSHEDQDDADVIATARMQERYKHLYDTLLDGPPEDPNHEIFVVAQAGERASRINFDDPWFNGKD